MQSDKPNWINGDSEIEIDSVDAQADLIFTCPPYHDLEIYTDHKDDLSNMSYDLFVSKYASIIKKSYDKLKDNRFFVVVITEIRELSRPGDYKIGKYKGFIKDTICSAEAAGFSYYNDIVFINSQAQAARVSKTYFERNKKVASTHQNILVFIKGNPDIATEEINSDGKYFCKINKVKYNSLRHAAISIDPNKLTASKIKLKFDSNKFKYKDWNIIGVVKKPIIKFEVSGMLFESVKQAASIITSVSERDIEKRFASKADTFSNWKRVDIKELTYTHVEETWKLPFVERVHTISCGGILFYTAHDAANYFKLTPRRITEKVNSAKHINYFRLALNC